MPWKPCFFYKVPSEVLFDSIHCNPKNPSLFWEIQPRATQVSTVTTSCQSSLCTKFAELAWIFPRKSQETLMETVQEKVKCLVSLICSSYSCPWCSAPVSVGHEILPDPDTAEVCSCSKLGFQRTERREAAAVAPSPVGLKYTNIESSDLWTAHGGSSVLPIFMLLSGPQVTH